MAKPIDKPLTQTGGAQFEHAIGPASVSVCGATLRADKWGGECWLTMERVGVGNMTDESQIGAILQRVFHRETHRWYPSHAGLQWEIEWAALGDVPASIEFRLEFPAGLNFWYQPELTPEEVRGGCFRPEEVVGSYAIYWNNSGRYLRPDGSERVNYYQGKFAHLFRPLLIDADGDTCRAQYRLEGKTLWVDLPHEWLSTAAFPVILDPEFGYHPTSGGTSAVTQANYVWASGPFSPASTGTCSSLFIYHTTDGNLFTVGVYGETSSLPDTLLRDSAEASGVINSWNEVALDSGLSIASGTNYWLAWSQGVDFGVKYDATGGSPTTKYKAATYDGGSLANPFGGSPTSVNRQYWIYGTYLEADVTAGTASLVSVDDSEISLTCTAAQSGTAPYTYQWHRSTTSGFTPGLGNALSGATSLDLTDTTASAGTIYYYKLVATDAGSDTDESNQLCVSLWKAPIVLGFLGDSITGTGTTCADAATKLSLMGGQRTVTTEVQGASGSATSDWQPAGSNYTTAVAAFASAGVTHVMVMLGTNDSKDTAAVSAATYATNLGNIVDELVSDGYTVILNYPPGHKPDVTAGFTQTSLARLQTYLAEIDALCNGTTILQGDTLAFEHFATKTAELAADGVHLLSTAGYVSMSTLWASTLYELLIDEAGGGNVIVIED